MKVILVIDMPHYCHDCICADWDQCLCKASNREIYSQEYMNGGRQTWCPLKPMPKKYELTTEKGNRYAVGWNDCIDEILGEEE